MHILRYLNPVVLFGLTLLLTAAGVNSATDFAFEPAKPFADITDMSLTDISHAGDRLVAVGERGLIMVSDDQGASWSQAESPVSTTLTAVTFASPELGWAVGHAGVILHSDDGGQSWSLQFDGRKANTLYLEYTRQVEQRLLSELSTAADLAAEDVDLGELEYQAEEAVFAREDAEEAVETGPADPFLDVMFLDTRNGFAVGAYGMIYRTSDGGASWQIAISGIENIDRFHYYAITADQAGNLYLSGEAGLLYTSRDGGLAWEKVESLYEGSLFGVIAGDESVLTFGLRGNLFRSTDQGRNWAQVENPKNYSLYGGRVSPQGEFLLVGAGGQLLRSRDGGATFEASNHPSRSTFSSVLTGTDNSLLAVGVNGLKQLNPGGDKHD